jgi:biofilm protein TabA
MIFGDLKHWKQEERAYSPVIRTAMEYLYNTDFTHMKAGKYEIDGNRMFCIVSESTTKSGQELKAESHESYMDIQYIVAGEEKIGFARLTDEQIVTQDLLESDDAFLYDDLQDEMELILRSGTYAIFFPADLHRPGGKLQEESQLKKAVIKVKLDF